MNSFPLKDRLQYWLDKKMARGTFRMIRVLVTAMVVFVFLTAILMVLLKMGDGEGFFRVFWDLLATTINEEWPRSEDGSAGYVFFSALAAGVGLLFTSVLIGIVTSAIEDRLAEMRKGTSQILEKGHVIILGFTPGEYSLISEVIDGFAGKRGTVIVADDLPREEMEDLIYENVDVPPTADVVCRSINITDQSELRCCSPQWASSVILSPGNNERILKAALSVEAILSENPDAETKILAAVDSSKYVIQRHMAENRHLTMLHTGDIVARLIAHCSTQPGLSVVFTDVFNYEGCEFYEEKVPGTLGKTFGEIVQIANGGSVVGISNNKGIQLNPDPGMRLKAEDKLVYFGEEKGVVTLEENYDYERPVTRILPDPVGVRNLVVIGYNETLGTILRELPERRYDVTVITDRVEDARKAAEGIRDRGEIHVTVEDTDLSDILTLEGIVSPMNYVVLLSNRRLDDDAADTEIMLLLFKLHDIRERLQLEFTVTAEMKREKNRGLIFLKDPTDFIIASNISSMMLAQIAGNYRLRRLFAELLSNKGSEIYLRPADALGCDGETLTIREIRHRAIEYNYLVIGYQKRDKRGRRDLHMNPDPGQTVTLQAEDLLVVVGKQ